MPLMQKKSKKAFEHNVKAEMKAGKPQKQSLAIAFSVKRKAKKASGGSVKSGSPDMNYAKGGKAEDKLRQPVRQDIIKSVHASMKKSGIKPEYASPNTVADHARKMGHDLESHEVVHASDSYADGGEVKESSTRSESRPMPDKRYNDSKEASRNSGDKPAKEDSWTSRPDIKQSQKGKTSPLKHPKMVPQSAYSVRLRDQEDDLQDSAGVNDGPQHQPSEQDNEEGPDRQGPKVPDMQRQHNDGRKAYAKGGHVEMEYGSGPEEDMAEHPAGLESDDDEMSPPEDEFMAGHFAEGGMIDNEEELEHAASIAAAIMSKMKSQRLAEGGEVVGSQDSMFDIMKKKRNGDDSIYAHPEEDQADLSRNAEEDANMEDQTSFNALRKENYSESEGLEALDQPHDSNLHGDPHEDDEENIHDGDIVRAIRSKMKRKSAITR